MVGRVPAGPAVCKDERGQLCEQTWGWQEGESNRRHNGECSCGRAEGGDSGVGAAAPPSSRAGPGHRSSGGLQGSITSPDEAKEWDEQGLPFVRSASMALPTVSEWLLQLRTLHLASQLVQGKGEPFLQEAN